MLLLVGERKKSEGEVGVLKSMIVSSVSPRAGWMGKVRSSKRAWTAGFEGQTIGGGSRLKSQHALILLSENI